MSVIAATTIKNQQGKVTVSRTTSTASDTFTYISGAGQLLELVNPTASPIVATVIGASATTISPTGLGATVSVASGYAITVPAISGVNPGTVVVNLDTIAAYLVGVTSITGGTGLTVALYQ